MTRAATFRAAAVTGAFLIAALMIMTASRAAFTNPTSNDGNAWDAGTVILTEATAVEGSGGLGDETGAAKWDATAGGTGVIAPGYSSNSCIQVDYTGTVAADVVLEEIDTTGSTGLEDDLTVTMSAWDGADCGLGTETVITAGVALNALAGPSASVAVAAGPVTLYFDTTIDLPASVDNTAQGDTAVANFQWLATNS